MTVHGSFLFIFYPPIISFIICLIAYLISQDIGLKRPNIWYLKLFLINILLLLLLVLFYFYSIITEILINYIKNESELLFAIIFICNCIWSFILHNYLEIFATDAPVDYILLSNPSGNYPLQTGAGYGSIIQLNPTGNNTMPPAGSTIESNPTGNNTLVSAGSTTQSNTTAAANPLPAAVDQPYDFRDIQGIIGLNDLHPKDWDLRTQLRLTESLHQQFFNFSLNPTKVEVVMFKDILKDNNVQDNWVMFNNSNSNKPSLYQALHNSKFEEMVRAKKISLSNQTKFLVTPNNSILN